MSFLPFSAHLPRPVAHAASLAGVLWPLLGVFINRGRHFLAQLRQVRLERRLHARAINSLQGVSPEVLRDIGAAPELIAELEAAEQLRQGRLGRPQHW
jgi:uncharacterized protein YjiS (DUF1127 family)